MAPAQIPPVVLAIVLAGGSGRRMGGADKASLVVGGRSLLDRVLASASAVAGRLVVIGPPRPLAPQRAVIFLSEDETGGGPVPAVAAGLEASGGAWAVVVLAVDLPLLRGADLARLVDALAMADPGVGAVAAADPRGRPNPLLAAYRIEALRSRLAAVATLSGSPASGMLPGAHEVLDLGQATTLNVNTEEDLRVARRMIRESGLGPC